MNQAMAFHWYTDVYLQNSGLDYGIINISFAEKYSTRDFYGPL